MSKTVTIPLIGKRLVITWYTTKKDRRTFLSDEQREEIYRLARTGLSQRAIGEMYRAHQSTISLIIRRENERQKNAVQSTETI